MQMLILYWAILINTLFTTPGQVSEIEEQALSSRRAIKSGQLDICVVLMNSQGNPSLKNEYWVEFEDEKLRFDFLASQNPNDASGQSGFKRQNILTAEGLFSHDDADHSGVNTAVVRVAPDDIPDQKPPLLFDPRLLGLSPSSFGALHAHHLELFVGNPQRTSVSVIEQELNGRKTSLVEYMRSDGAKARIWIDPVAGHNVVRAELESTYRSAKSLNRIDCSLKQNDVDGIWFPEVINYEEFLDDASTFRETVTIRSARFNFDVSDDRFTLATMNIPPGTPIADSADNPNGTQMWNGENLVRMANSDLVASSLTEPIGAESSRYWIVLLTSNLLIIGAIVLYWRYRKNQAA